MNKKELREIYLQKRLSLTEGDRLKADDLMLIQLQRLTLDAPQLLFTYFPLEKSAEPDTFLFTRYLQYRFPGLQVCYPRLNNTNRAMEAVLTDEETHYEVGNYGLTEPVAGKIISPAEIDMVFIPLLCFDSAGFRVGYGKGYYDKFLVHCSKEAVKVGFSYFEAIDKIDDRGAWDVPLDYCIIPNTTYAF